MTKFGNACRVLTLALLASAAAVSAHAEGKLEARYTASLAGIPIGKGSWTIDIADTHYTAAASGTTTGLIKVFVGGHGTGAAQGAMANGRPVSSNYSATIKTSRHTDEVRMTVAGGAVKDFKLEPPLDDDPKRIPVTDAQRQGGVLDPMTASLVLMPGTGEMRGPQACDRTTSVFDGKLRYDLKTSFKRMENVKAEKGYVGPAVVCGISFVPVSGYVPSRAAIRYLTEPHEMEVWLVPIAGTRAMVPFRAQVETPFGMGVIEATQFVSEASPPHTGATKGMKSP